MAICDALIVKLSRACCPLNFEIFSSLCKQVFANGLLEYAGKYTETKKPGGPRDALFNDDRIKQIQPLLSLMRDIGSAHGGKSCAQVAVNWVISKGEQTGLIAIPILGVLPMLHHLSLILSTGTL